MTIINTILNSNVFNFAIVVAFVVWIIKKVDLASLIAKKCAEIAEIIKNAEEEKQIKLNHLEITRNKVSNLNQEVIKIATEGEQVAKKLSESILEDAQKQSEELHRKAVASVENEKQVVSGEVMTKITSAAFYIAEEHIKQAIDDRLHRKYIDEFIDGLDKIHN